MKPKTKAYFVREGGKLITDIIRVVMVRPHKRAIPEEEEQAPPSEELIAEPTTQPKTKALPPIQTEAGAEVKEDVSTACVSCTRSHLSTVSGALGEALRFAREDGIAHPEVQRRILLSEDEINIMERIDLAPDALAASPPEEKQLVTEYLPRIRKLRQEMGEITSLEKLEEVAAEASILGQEFRLRALQLRGVDLNPVMELARKVQAGEISMDEAKDKLKEILPEGE